MVGESQLVEQAKKQWEKIDAEGHKIINDLITEDTEGAVWPENMKPKFTGCSNGIAHLGMPHVTVFPWVGWSLLQLMALLMGCHQSGDDYSQLHMGRD